MPIFDFKCDGGHVTEKVFLTFAAAEGAETILCPGCRLIATRQIGVPFPAHLYGNPEGYHKPSPAKRHSYKTVSAITGNKHSAC